MTDRTTVASATAGYRPRLFCEEAAAFARAVVAGAAPESRSRARALLWSCAKLAAFGISVRLDPVPEVLLHPSVIERFIVVGAKTMSGPARRTLRTNLRFCATRSGSSSGPAPVPLSRERAKAPYARAEIAAYLALFDAQPTLSRRMRSGGFICLGAGAGLMGADLRAVRGTDVVIRSGGVLVDVAGRRPRTVPVLARYHDRLLGAARFTQEGFVIGGENPARKYVTTPLLRSLAGGVDLPQLDTGRLRATWLCACAEQLGLRAFMDAAGIICSQRLGDLVSELPGLDETEAVTLLGGRR